jgi:CHAT domain-containing protein
VLLREAREVLEELKTAELRDYFRDECLAAQELRPLEAVPGAVILYPFLLPDRLELLVARGEELSLVTAAASSAAVIEESRRLNQLLQDRTTRLYRDPARKLYEWLIRPVENLLGEGEETLVIVPSGILHQIPLAALIDPRSGKFLVERVPTAMTPGIRLTDPEPIDRRRTELLVAGLTASVEGFPALPSVREEIAAVASSFPSVTLVDDEFSVSGFIRAFDSRPFGIVHIASHGEFLGESGESYLLASDRRLSMSELGEIVGRSRFRTEQPLELLTLSACRTAKGDDRAALGLAGVAIQSGARSALAALWSVDDRAATELISEFYRQLAIPGVSRAKALQLAQQKLIASEEFRHPSNWAPFLLINSWL